MSFILICTNFSVLGDANEKYKRYKEKNPKFNLRPSNVWLYSLFPHSNPAPAVDERALDLCVVAARKIYVISFVIALPVCRMNWNLRGKE